MARTPLIVAGFAVVSLAALGWAFFGNGSGKNLAKPGSAIHRRQESFSSYLNEGNRCLKTGETTRAKECFTAALSVQPGSASARVGLARVAVREEQPLEALKLYEEALGMTLGGFADNPTVNYEYAKVCDALGRRSERDEAYLKILSDSSLPTRTKLPKSLFDSLNNESLVAMHTILAREYQSEGEDDSFKAEVQEALRLAPKLAQNQANLAQVCFVAGLEEDGVRLTRLLAATNGPHQESAKRHLAELGIDNQELTIRPQNAVSVPLTAAQQKDAEKAWEKNLRKVRPKG